MKRFLSYVKGWRGIALITYMWLILMAWVIMYVDITSSEAKRRLYAVSVAEVILVALIYICPKLLEWAERQNIHPDFHQLAVQERCKFFLHTWLYVFLAFFAVYIVFYPGGLSSDNIGQYSQAMGIRGYQDHHPVFHTLFAYTLPLKLTGGWIGSINLFQIVVFSLSMAYMTYTVYEYGSYLYAKRFLLYLMLNPITLCISVIPLKDLSFAIASMLLMTFATHIHFTEGAWLKSIRNTSVFIIVMTSATLFRHNGILFTLPMLFAVSLYIKKSRALLMLLCFLGLFWGVKYPLYDYLKVDRASNNRQIEACGLCMTIIGNVVKEVPERLDDEILEFAYSVAPKEIWEKKFNVFRGWDHIKFLPGNVKNNNSQFLNFLDMSEADINAAKRMDIQTVERVGWKKILLLTLRCFQEAPFEALKGLLGITAINYGIIGSVSNLDAIPSIHPNNLGLSSVNFFKLNFLSPLFKKIIPEKMRSFQRFRKGDISLQSLLIITEFGLVFLLKHIFWHVGVINLVIIIFILAKLNFHKAHDWKRLCLVLPLLVHNFGTMLLLMAPIFRYFYVSFLVLPPLLLILLRGKEDN